MICARCGKEGLHTCTPRCGCGHRLADHWPGEQCLVPACACKRYHSRTIDLPYTPGDPSPARFGEGVP